MGDYLGLGNELTPQAINIIFLALIVINLLGELIAVSKRLK